jgi:DNA topoisomerase-1
VIDDLKKASSVAKKVYLAPDPDREGEAIAWHLKETLALDSDKAKRVTFNEITKEAIKRAFDKPREIEQNLVNAQQARRVLDRLVGYKISPLLWKKVFRGLSAGRVQSVAVRLICEREREIKAFVPQEYWSLTAYLGKAALSEEQRAQLQQFIKQNHGKNRAESVDNIDSPDEIEEENGADAEVKLPGGVFAADLRKWKGENPTLATKSDIDAILAVLDSAAYVVSKLETKERKDRPKPPYITSTLQQAASIRLGYSARKTMQIAQRLYEGIDIGEEGPTGLITYMRTDSVHLSDFAVNDARELIEREYGGPYLPEKPNFYKTSGKAQAAHEAIRPTSVARTPESVRRYLDNDQFRLYRMIWERFVSCQMEPAVYAVTTVEVTAGDALFRASGRRLVFDGHARVSGIKLDKNEQLLPPLSEQDALNRHDIRGDQHFTLPPPRYSEASLVKTLEKLGIGRPSTYATIIGTIQDRNYVRSESRRLFATDLGMMVNDIMVANFERIVDTDFTSKMEAQLDKIEEGELDWIDVLGNFYAMFVEELALAEQKIEKIKGRTATDENGVEVACPVCNAPMVDRYSKNGKFFGCSRFPECKGTMPLDKRGRILRIKKEDIECPLCGKELVVRMSRRGPFLGCSTFPACRGTRSLDSEKSIKQLEQEAEFAGLTCDQCQKPMQVRFFRNRPFIGCIGYPDCKNTYNPAKAREAIDAGTLTQDAAAVAAAREKAERIKKEREEEKARERENAPQDFDGADSPADEEAA